MKKYLHALKILLAVFFNFFSGNKLLATTTQFPRFQRNLLLFILMLASLGVSGQKTYTLVTSPTDLVAGTKYVIGSAQTTSTQLMGYQNTNNRPQSTGGSYAITSGNISITPATTSGDTVKPYELTLGGSTGAWTLTDAATGIDLQATNSSNNYLKSGSGTWTITFATNTAVITCTNGGSNKIIRYNSGSILFTCYASGQAAVYLYKEVPAVACSGTPAGGTLTVNPTSGAPASTYGVTATGYTIGTGLTYQWQYNDGSGWNNQGTPTSSYAALTGMVAPAYGVVRTWKLVVTCTASAASADSSTGTFTSSYCASVSSGSSGSIADFTTSGGITNITNNTSGYSTNGYGDFTSKSVSQYLSSVISFSSSLNNISSGVGFGVWVDWNQDGDFNDAGESVYNSSGYLYTNPSAINFTVPGTATLGSTRMRIVSNYNLGTPTSCNATMSNGETEDYTFTVVAAVACSGTPTGGTLTVNPTSGAPASTYGVTATGYTTGFGLTYQWQYSDTGGAPWSNQGTATSSYAALTGMVAPAFGIVRTWKLVVTCTASASSADSTTATFTSTYCLPTGGSSSTSYYLNSIITTLGVTNINYTASSYSRYVNNAATSFSQNAGSAVTVNMAAAGGSNYYYYCWVDWNNDGDFADTGETIFATTGYTANYAGSIPVSAGQAAGNYRVRFGTSYSGTITSCGPAPYGNYVDYTLSVIAAAACSTPLAQPTTLILTPAATSVSGSFTASATANGYLVVRTTTASAPTAPTSGTAYTAGTTALGGFIVKASNTLTFTDSPLSGGTQYWYWVFAYNDGCTGQPAYLTSGPLSGNTTTLVAYCIPAPTSVDGTGITNVTIGTINNTTGAEAGNYGNYSAQITDVTQGDIVNFSITYKTGYTYGTKIWVDWNNDGDFADAGEQVYYGLSTSANPTTLSDSFLVPAGAILGNHRIRIGGTDTDTGPSDACYTGSFGCFEDYTLNVLALPACSGTPNGGTVTVNPTTGAPASTYGVTATGYTKASGLTFQWQYSDTGGAPWSNQGSATSSYAALTGMVAPAFGVVRTWKLVVTCTASALSADSTTGTFTTGYCVPTGTTSYWITNFTTTGGLTNINNGTVNSNIYGNYSFLVFSQYAGSAINLSISTSSGTHYFYGWVDWNNDGDFEDAGEAIFSTSSFAGSYSGSYLISAAQPAGSYRMRIANNWSGTAITSCAAAGSSEYEDYTLSVVALPVCSGAPSSGTTILTPSTGSPSSIFIASVTGDSVASGLTYQWESSPNGSSSWTDVVGAATATANITAVSTRTITYYRRKITCTSSGLFDYSSVETYITDYCTATTNPRAENLYIDNVSFVGTLADQSNNNNGHTTNGFQDFTVRTPAVQADGRVMNITASVSGDVWVRGSWKAWVDWNQDGNFTDAGELVYSNYRYLAPTVNFGFIVPPGQTPGNYRLRIRVNDYVSGGKESLGKDFGPCDNFTSSNNNNGDFGETEDYLIKIIYNCPAKIIDVNVNAGDGHLCGPGSVTLTATATPGAVINWYSSPTNPMSIYTGNTFLTPDISGSTTYYVTASLGGCETVFRQPVLARIDPRANVTFSTDILSICGDGAPELRLNTSGDKYVDTVIDEKFTSSLGVFENITPAGYLAGTDTEWLNKPSPYKPVDPPYPILQPALSSGFYGESFAIIDTDFIRTVPVLNYLQLTGNIDASTFNATTLKLDFDLYYYTSSVVATNAAFKVDYSINGGAWINLSTITTNQGDPNNWSKQTIPLPPGCYFANLKIRFSGFGNSPGKGWIGNIAAIDNVRMYGEKNLTTPFSWTGDTGALFQGDCTTPIGTTKSNSVCIKPNPTQLENDASWTITAITSFSNGCPATGTITINNDTKTWNSGTTDWATKNWKPFVSGLGTSPPNGSNCVYVKTPVTLGVGATGAAKNIIVQGSGNLTIAGNLTVTDFIKNKTTPLASNEANLVLESDANLIQINSGAANSGRMTAKRTVTGLVNNPAGSKVDYVYWGSPVDGQQTFGPGGFSPGTPANRFYYYQESNDRFYPTGNTTFIPGRGYAVQAESDQGTAPYTKDYVFKGTPNNGDITFNISKSADTVNGGITYVHGYNLVSNPYPSNIKFDELYQGNSSLIWNNAYFWTNASYTQYQQGSTYGGNNYAAYNGTGGNPATITTGQPEYVSGVIKVGQGFLVQKKVLGTNGLIFKNSYGASHDLRVTNPGTFFSRDAVQKNRYWLTLLAPSNLTNSQLIGYVPGATNDYEQDYDSEAFDLSSDLFYSVLLNEKLLIQGKSEAFTNDDKVTLGANFFTNGTYTIALDRAEGIFNGSQNIYLKDKQQNIITNLSQGSYTFTTTKGDNATRFEIIYKPETVLATDASVKEDLVVYRKENDFVVKSPNKKITTLEVYDTAGRLIYTAQPKSTEAVIPAEKLLNSVYVVKINRNGEVSTKKIIR